MSRAVVQLNPTFHPDGKRFLVKQYSEDKEWRPFKLNPRAVSKLETHVAAKGLGADDVLFQMRQDSGARPRIAVLPDTAPLGKTGPNEKGNCYDHGTLSAYSAAKCRCEHCRGAYPLYRRERRSAGKDSPGARAWSTPTGTSRTTGSA